MKQKKYIYIFKVDKEKVFVQSNTMGEAEDNLNHWIKNRWPLKNISVTFSERKDNPPPRSNRRIEELTPPSKRSKKPSNATSNVDNPNE